MTFLSRPVFDFRPDHTSLRHGQLDDLRLDGLVSSPWRATTSLKRRVTLPFLLDSRRQWRDFRDFFAARRGRLDGFWLPAWMDDYRADSLTAGASVIDCAPVGLAGVFAFGGQHGYCAVLSPERIEPHQITSVAVVSGRERLTLAGPLGAFDPGRTMVCAMLYVRLADTLVYEFVSDQCVRTDVTFEELPHEYSGAGSVSSPIYCYEITRNNLVWRLTNWTEAVTDNEGSLWTPGNIWHGRASSGGDFLGESLDVECQTDDPNHPLRYWLHRGALEKVTLSIYRLDAGDLTIHRGAPVYVGRLENAEYPPGGRITVRASSILRISEQQSPRMMIQRTCNHRLFDLNCGVNESLNTTTGLITGLTDAYVESPAFGLLSAIKSDPDWFALGRITVGGEARQIVGAAVNRLYVDEPFLRAKTGDTVSAAAGCNKRVMTCLNKYGNLARTIQFPYIPNRNPQYEALQAPKPGGGKKS